MTQAIIIAVLILLTTITDHQVDGARFLAFVPLAIKSHQRIIQPYLEELANKGHHVVCYSPFPLENPPSNYKSVKLPDLFSEMKKQLVKNDSETEDYTQIRKSMSLTFMIFFFKQTGLHLNELIFKLPEFQDLLKSNEKYDAVILESTFLQENLIALGHKFNAPVIDVLPIGNLLWVNWLLGNPFDTSFIGESALSYTDRMTFYQRFSNTIFNGLTRLVWYNYYIPLFQEQMDRCIRYEGWQTRPSMVDMISNISLVLVNSHYSVNYPYPNAPHFKEVGGLNIVPPKPLPKDLQHFMDSAQEGVIYFTLGSHIPVSVILGTGLKEVFLNVFSELKQKVLWKWETEFPNLPPNIKISKWFPQQDILAHKNIKMFITHGGMLSTTEAVYQGVPTIGIPVMADQYKNVAHMEHYKYGIQLDLENITHISLKWAINEILNNQEYTINAKKQSQLFRDKPKTALETAVYWTEYVLRHKGAHHLKPAISTMPWYQQAMIDVYTAILLIILIPIYIMYKIVKCFVYCISCRSNKQNIVSKSKKIK